LIHRLHGFTHPKEHYMPSAAIPTVTPSFRLLAGLLTAQRWLGRKLGDARLKGFRGGQPGHLKATRLQRDEMMAMSSHELSDLGIGRSEIPALLGEPSSWRAGRY
jgi:uncharacterized protein YjiS (DUF1127 family)